MSHTRIEDDGLRDEVLRCARGQYQRNILHGIENMSGSTLKGRAREYSSKYTISRNSLLLRIRARGILAYVVDGVLVIERLKERHYVERAESVMVTGARPAWDRA